MLHKFVPAAFICFLIFVWFYMVDFEHNPVLVPTYKYKPHEPYNFPVLPLTEPTTRSSTFDVTEKMTANGMRTLINDEFPGPAIQAVEGDTIEVTVVNNSPNPVSMHMHGFEQRGTNHMDGVAGLTQCPIQPGQNFTYSTNASMAGTYWYHNHVGIQAIKGLSGPIVVQERRELDYTEESVVFICDVYTRTAQNLFTEFMEPNVGGNEPQPKTFMIFGTNRPHSRVRLINASSQLAFSVNLRSEVVEVDGHPVEPRVVDSVKIAAAQRYSIFPLLPEPLEIQVDETGFNIFDLAFRSLHHETPPPATISLVLEATMEPDEYGVRFPLFNNTQRHYGRNPLEAYVAPRRHHNQLRRHAQDLLPTYDGETVEVTIYNKDDASHPFHLHGHKFWVMQRGSKTAPFPILRDTVWVDKDNFVTIRFTADNPGLWILHCHNVWHSAAGMHFAFASGPDKIPSMSPASEWFDLCIS